MSHKTILPYVGAKSYNVRRIVQYFPQALTAMGSPFMGGGSIEIHMQARGVRVFAGDLCEELTVFWQEVLRDAPAVAEALRREIPIQYPLDGYRQRMKTAWGNGGQSGRREDLAVLFYILIQCGFSHIPARRHGGSPQATEKLNKHWRDSFYPRMRRFSAPRLSVEHLDCFAFMEKYPELFLYCDPPYANGSQNLYGFGVDLHSGFPHERFRDALMARETGWVLSYGDCEAVRDWYAGCVFVEMEWFYGASVTGGNVGRQGRELLILPPGADVEQNRRFAEGRALRAETLMSATLEKRGGLAKPGLGQFSI